MQTLRLFALSPLGLRHRDVRPHLAQVLGRDLGSPPPALRPTTRGGCRFHRLIERVPHTHRYRVAAVGARLVVLSVRIDVRGFRPAASPPTGRTEPLSIRSLKNPTASAPTLKPNSMFSRWNRSPLPPAPPPGAFRVPAVNTV